MSNEMDPDELLDRIHEQEDEAAWRAERDAEYLDPQNEDPQNEDPHERWHRDAGVNALHCMHPECAADGDNDDRKLGLLP